jgi:hypothetical protein
MKIGCYFPNIFPGGLFWPLGRMGENSFGLREEKCWTSVGKLMTWSLSRQTVGEKNNQTKHTYGGAGGRGGIALLIHDLDTR